MRDQPNHTAVGRGKAGSSVSKPEPVLITEKEFRKAEEIFLQCGFRVIPAPAQEEPLAAAVLKEKARAVIIGVERYTGPLYSALKQTGGERGAVLVRFGVGHDGVDKVQAQQKGILVCNTPGVLDISVAELAIGLMANLARRLSRAEMRLRAGEFAGDTGAELHGKRLGILGFGRIGRRVAAMAHFGFGMEVWALGTLEVEQFEIREKRSLAEIRVAYGLAQYTTCVERLLGESDILSLHLTATPATHHFINAARLALVKPTAMLVNTARGSLVDESALYDALADRRFAGAALDVFETEPYQPVAPEKDLRQLPNTVLTPHLGSNTRETNRRIANACLTNLTHFFKGEFKQLTQVPPR